MKKYFVLFLSFFISIPCYAQVWENSNLAFSSPGTHVTKFQFAEHSWSGSHAILFNAYKQITQHGSLSAYGNTKFANDIGSYSGGAGSIMFFGNGGTMDFLISSTSIGEGEDIEWGIPKMRIYRNGNIGIGTTTADHKLDVNGVIRAKEIKVETNWSDFVFEDDYNLKSLDELEAYINKNKHLPDIPSESEVKEKGINLGEINAKLLQKIEELTLYVIEQNKEIKSLKKKIHNLQRH